MTSRDRVLAAIHHEEPDRVPIVIGASNATGMKMRPYLALARDLGIEVEERYLYDWPELGTARMDERVLERLHVDVRGVVDAFPAATRERNRTRPPHSPFVDDWGTGQVEIEDGTWYPGLHPMKDALTLAEIEAYPWPDMDDPTRVAHVRAEAAALAAANEYAIMGTPWLLFPFERAIAMQGLEECVVNFATEPDFSRALLRRITDLCKTLMGHFLDEIGENVDIVKIGDDLGSQQSLLISPTMYRDLLKPMHADLISFIRSRTKAKVFFHTDGDVFDLVEDLVEIGVDILNPIQTSAGKMADIGGLKCRYGERVAFCGAIDTQHILPNGTPDEVRAEVRRVLDLLAPGGGFMVASVHTIMNEVPAENILAMVDETVAYGRYPVRA